MKKTAVQKLIDYLEKTYIFMEGGKTVEQFKKALEEEQEQIETAFKAGTIRGEGDIPFNCEQYYSQTFKND